MIAQTILPGISVPRAARVHGAAPRTFVTVSLPTILRRSREAHLRGQSPLTRGKA